LSVEREQAQARGRRAESLACWFLRAKGYRILERNWRCPQGEIDILARRGNVLAAIEVKSRPDVGKALEAIGARQRRRIERALSAYLAAHPSLGELSIRFDAITLAGWRGLRHLAQAWRPEGT